MISQEPVEHSVLLIGENHQTLLPNHDRIPAFLTAHITIFDPHYDPSLLQYMYMSLNTVFHQEYNDYFTERFCSCLSADNALCAFHKTQPNTCETQDICMCGDSWKPKGLTFSVRLLSS